MASFSETKTQQQILQQVDLSGQPAPAQRVTAKAAGLENLERLSKQIFPAVKHFALDLHKIYHSSQVSLLDFTQFHISEHVI